MTYILPNIGNVFHLAIDGKPACGVKLGRGKRRLMLHRSLILAKECRTCYEIEKRQELLKELGE